MPRRCTICDHHDRELIDKALVSPGQGSLRDVAERFHVSKTALHRHKVHVSARLRMSRVGKEILEADTLARSVKLCEDRALNLLAKAEALLDDAAKRGDHRGAASVLRACCSVLGELLDHFRLRGELGGELGGKGPAPGPSRAILLLPCAVPIGSPADLRMQLPPEAVRRALEGPKREIIDIEAS